MKKIKILKNITTILLLLSGYQPSIIGIRKFLTAGFVTGLLGSSYYKRNDFNKKYNKFHKRYIQTPLTTMKKYEKYKAPQSTQNKANEILDSMRRPYSIRDYLICKYLKHMAIQRSIKFLSMNGSLKLLHLLVQKVVYMLKEMFLEQILFYLNGKPCLPMKWHIILMEIQPH